MENGAKVGLGTFLLLLCAACFLLGNALDRFQHIGMICYKPMPVTDTQPFLDCTKDPMNCGEIVVKPVFSRDKTQVTWQPAGLKDPDLEEVETLADQDEHKGHIEP